LPIDVDYLVLMLIGVSAHSDKGCCLSLGLLLHWPWCRRRRRVVRIRRFLFTNVNLC